MALDRKNPKNVPGVKDSGFSTPSLDRALAILKCLGGHPAGLTLSQIATELGLPVNFVYRVTQSLVAHQYLVRDSQKRFSMGVGLLGLCQPVCDDVPLTEAALPKALFWSVSLERRKLNSTPSAGPASLCTRVRLVK
ncbi:MAG: hypothetical protein EBR81_08260 [Proteobacteria bacterium]|nr:hypothetical protein [Pseudomonadota bacterium]